MQVFAASRVQRTIAVTIGTLPWASASAVSISNIAVFASTDVTARSIVANGGWVANVRVTFVDVFAAVDGGQETGSTSTTVGRAHLVEAAVAFGSAADLAILVETKLSTDAIAVRCASHEASSVDANLAVGAIAARSSTPFTNARQSRGASRFIGTYMDHPDAAQDGRRVTHKARGTSASRLVVVDDANGVGSANAFDFAGVPALVLRAGLVVRAIVVGSATRLTITVWETSFPRRTTSVAVTRQNAMTVDAFFSASAFFVLRTEEPALSVDASLRVSAFVSRETDEGLADTAFGGLFRGSSES